MDKVVRSFLAAMNKVGVAAFSAAATRTLRRCAFPSQASAFDLELDRWTLTSDDSPAM